ncbi:kunitz-type serine protease inhibitor bitisilin-3 isoform X1 [Drosophila obscura]|uniref:kunitz-type serine protease inhibitor bitisilin-3 isoform X1 n=2 Tax=Drosophila obscura TaxID=7282 RepID=UPI001BB1AD70|nr:kunitz-type serine protease inhibitor bitisilin-3 isoform X1 [Drosophila obscura]
MRVALLGVFLPLALETAVSSSLNETAKCESAPTLTGPCTNYTKKWYYASLYRECIMFDYGGCGQTNNLFDSEEHCESLCLGMGPHGWLCLWLLLFFALSGMVWAYNAKKCDDVQTETGTCNLELEMFRFDNVNRQCESFIYGGCGATNNFFESGMDCVLNCLEHHEF